jgi:hypothetical protein
MLNAFLRSAFTAALVVAVLHAPAADARKPATGSAAPATLDSIVAVVEEDVVLRSELNAEINRILATDEMKKRFADFGAETTPASADAFTAMFKREIAMWSKVVKDANIKAE